MKRFERRRVERVRRAALTIGLSFAMGALTALGLTWRGSWSGPPAPRSAEAPELAVGRVPRPSTSSGRSERVEERSGPAVVEESTPTATIGPAIALIPSRDRELAMPVDGVDRDDLRDNYLETRDGRPHEALDIMAPRGTPVRAVRDGHIEKLFTSQAGGLTIYQFEPSGTYAFYYAHLDRYAPDLKEGQKVEEGDIIGYVGSTGNASLDAPHLHFGVFRLTPERQWWKGAPLNPYSLLK